MNELLNSRSPMLTDYTQHPVLRLLVDRTRRRDVSGPSLADAHRRVGNALAPDAAHTLALCEVPIMHPTGPSKGVAIASDDAPIIVPLMRGGLFVAEGVWETLPGATLLPWDGTSPLDDTPVAGRHVMLCDSVVNSGKSMIHAAELMRQAGAAAVTVVAITANDRGLTLCRNALPDVRFVVARVSTARYVGRGGTDTGARLFGTTTWACEQLDG